MTICVTTGYKNINRGSWKNFNRPREVYEAGFRTLVENCPYPLVAYLEEPERQEFSISSPNLKILPMEGLNILAYSHMEKDWAILNSPGYKTLMSGSPHKEVHPERSKKGYNMVTSSKSNLLIQTKQQFPKYEFYAWQDFGVANLEGGVPKQIDLSKLRKDKITVTGTKYDPTIDFPIDPVGYARTGGGSHVCSAQIIVPSGMVHLFDMLMRKQVDFNHGIFLTDDDQSVLTVVINTYPAFFDWVPSPDNYFGLYDRLLER